MFFDFTYLIEKYATSFVLKIPVKSGYDKKGDYKKAEPIEKTLKGAIISHRESKVFKSEGTLTAQDRALYMLEPLTDALEGAEVIHGGKVYSISSLLENAEFTGVYAYTLKYVSVFGGGGKNA